MKKFEEITKRITEDNKRFWAGDNISGYIKEGEKDILIDDREDTIERWNTAGGTGIHYKSASQVLNDLKKLGL